VVDTYPSPSGMAAGLTAPLEVTVVAYRVAAAVEVDVEVLFEVVDVVLEVAAPLAAHPAVATANTIRLADSSRPCFPSAIIHVLSRSETWRRYRRERHFVAVSLLCPTRRFSETYR
jgi:hypothetical protein